MKLTKNQARSRRHYRVRTIIAGTAERPRICIYRSNRHLSAQVIDDAAGRTLTAVTSVRKTADGKNHCNIATAQLLGKSLGEQMKAKGITSAVFDRGGFLYHGVVKAFADGVRAADEAGHFNF